LFLISLTLWQQGLVKDPPSKTKSTSRIWTTVVRISAGIIIRDFGDDAYDQARLLARQAQLDQNEMAIRLWNAVADEIAMRDKSKLQ
jgi:hypothetical protein